MPSGIGAPIAFPPITNSTGTYTSSGQAGISSHIGIGITEITPPDIVEISAGASGQTGSSPGGTVRTYSPQSLSDRFGYEISNGFFRQGGRLLTNTVRSGSQAAATYRSRGQAGRLFVGKEFAGLHGAIFSLRYQGASPDGNGILNRQAINEFRRIASQNLPLLSTL